MNEQGTLDTNRRHPRGARAGFETRPKTQAPPPPSPAAHNLVIKKDMKTPFASTRPPRASPLR